MFRQDEVYGQLEAAEDESVVSDQEIDGHDVPSHDTFKW